MDAQTFFLTLPNEVQETLGKVISQYGENYVKAINPTNRSKTKAAKIMHKLIDKSTEEFLKSNHASCKKGCAYCCYVYVEITIDEALAIKNYCIQNNLHIDKETLKKQSALKAEHWGHNKCVFLDENNTCSIYEVRPMTCRKYYVASEPKLCDVTTGTHKIAILHNIDVEMMTAGIFRVRDTGSLSQQLLKIIQAK
jgi:Fe-S-cluster containining protein